MSTTGSVGLASPNPILRRVIAVAISLILLIAIFWLMPLVTDIVTVIIISLVLSYSLRPIMTYLERRGINRVVTILIIFVAFTALMVLAFAYMVPILIQQLSDFGSTINQIDVGALRTKSIEWIGQYIPQLVPLLEQETGEATMFADQARTIISGLLEQSANLLAGLLNTFTLLSIMPILIFFMLKDGRAFTQAIVSRVPNRFFEMTLSLMHKINNTIGDYIVSVIISSLFIGVLTWIGLYFIDVKYSLALGVVSALFNVIPFFGPMLTMVVVFAVVLLTETAVMWPLIWAAIIMFVLQQIESIVVKPMLLSQSMSIHPAAVILAVLVGGRIAGAIGMFVAIPVYSIIHMFVVDLYDHLKNYRII
jgi:predicted PurR-regulated permease PerM